MKRIFSTFLTSLFFWLATGQVLFFLFHVFAGDPVALIAGPHANAEVIASLRAEYGFDLPLSGQWVRYWSSILYWDWGHSYFTREPIGNLLLSGIKTSLWVSIPGFLICALLSFFIGLLLSTAALKRSESWVLALSTLLMSVPALALILLVQYVFSYRLGWFPISGAGDLLEEKVRSSILPMFLWILIHLGYEVRFVRTALVTQENSDYLRTALAKGLGESRTLLFYLARNAIGPWINHLFLSFPHLILGSFLIESFFSLPGVGGLVVQALHSNDLPLLKALTLMLSAGLILSQWVAENSLRLLDPRVARGGSLHG